MHGSLRGDCRSYCHCECFPHVAPVIERFSHMAKHRRAELRRLVTFVSINESTVQGPCGLNDLCESSLVVFCLFLEDKIFFAPVGSVPTPEQYPHYRHLAILQDSMPNHTDHRHCVDQRITPYCSVLAGHPPNEIGHCRKTHYGMERVVGWGPVLRS